ncbi:MAG: DegT/DnrJ/EryC1/StrS family aminotransferase [Pseudomonadota bacterium]
MKKIPVCNPVIPENAMKYVNEVIQANWISSSCPDQDINFIKKLEKGFSAFVGTKYGVTTTSGTSALNLAVSCLNLGKGDEIIMPSFTMISTATCAVHHGARPVFVDACKDTWCMDSSMIEKAITRNTKAIMPVHIYGYPADMNNIMSIAAQKGLYVIEDAAHAIGTQYYGHHAGSMGIIGCFSFYANKIVTSGEGGMLVTNDPIIARRANYLKNHAFSETRFIHEDFGYNYRMNNLTAAYGYASFEGVRDNIKKKTGIAQWYNTALKNVEGILLPPESNANIQNSYWMYAILIDKNRFGRDKSEVRQLLAQNYAIETRDFFYPLHKQPAIIRSGLSHKEDRLPVSEMLWDRGCYLPSGVDLNEKQINYIAESLEQLRR